MHFHSTPEPLRKSVECKRFRDVSSVPEAKSKSDSVEATVGVEAHRVDLGLSHELLLAKVQKTLEAKELVLSTTVGIWKAFEKYQ